MNKLAINDTVELLIKPNGFMSRHYPLTIGRHYIIKNFDGSNVCTTCDEPNLIVSYWIGSVKKICGNS